MRTTILILAWITIVLGVIGMIACLLKHAQLTLFIIYTVITVQSFLTLRYLRKVKRG